LTTGPQLLITLGLVIGFFTCYGTARIESSFSWRTPFLILACLSALFSTAALLWLVPSPRWLTLHGRQAEAARTWDLLGVSPAEREKVEIEQDRGTPLEIQVSREVISIPSVTQTAPATKERMKAIKDKLLDIFSKDVRSRTALAVFLMGMQQLSGIDGVLYVSCRMFL
jgi:DNA-directed RNA polymerase III subunit RPC2